MKCQLVFLGTGSSTGVPIIGCQCAVCRSTSSYNKRLRTSALIKIGQKQFLIDAGPDLRQQALQNGITDLDGVLLTHAHHDHIAGIDELRVFYFSKRKPIPVLLSKETAAEIYHRYDYIFKHDHAYDKLVPRLDLRILPGLEGEIIFEDVPIKYVTFEQGGMLVNGFKIGKLAYLSDIRLYSPTIFNHLKGVEIAVVSALKQQSTDLHFSIDEAIEFIEKLGAKKGFLTHLSHEIDYHEVSSSLPSHIKLAYDGLKIDFD